MCYYVRDMYEDRSGFRDFNVKKKLLVSSLRSLLVIMIPYRCLDYACSTILRLA